MPWEDCVVDVHSTKYSQSALESMFSKCGAVRTVVHWKGQGEKQHVFMEYRSPRAAESARAMGLDRSDLQVIKLSNNEILKRKFRELEKLTNRPRSAVSYSEWNVDEIVSLADTSFLRKPPVSSCAGEHGTQGRYEFSGPDGARSTRGHNEASPAPFLTSFVSSSRAVRPRLPASFHNETLLPLPMDTLKGFASPKLNSAAHYSVNTDEPLVHSCVVPSSDPYHGSTAVKRATHYSSALERGAKNTLNKSTASQTVIEIPHAGEVIKFDLEKQLETNPAGIICLLASVKADQKLWMMTAAHYNSKGNLEAAREVLEAGIYIATQTGLESDTKPFWHLLKEINANLTTRTITCSSVISSSPITSTSTFTSNSLDCTTNRYLPESPENFANVSPFMEAESRLSIVTNDSTCVAPAKRKALSSTSEPQVVNTTLTELYSSQQHPVASSTHHQLRIRDSRLGSCLSAVAPTCLLNPPARLHSLQSELNLLREKQAVVLKDLSFTRAGKRRAEDELTEERSMTRKLEKQLRVAEDALSRSKRMEDAALDQITREVEARRKAEELFATIAHKDRPGTASMLANPGVKEATVLLHLASLMQGVSSI